MDYIVFARKWRPQTFDDVAGQEHVTATLKNAIDLNRIAHAYIFSGPRGVGKTSTARIFAKALNCINGPTSTPCNNCVMCKEITNGSSMDVLEIDGASNRGIDEIRNLRENVKFTPAGGNFKIYIIDEVHMLTPEAFNALLKTLEEPPNHVKFIFATTRPEKVLSTILSRCQRFDFKKISESIITKKLKEIAAKEKIDIEEDALFSVARFSEGSLRDAESILDQLVNLYQRKITSEDVAVLLGVVSYDLIKNFTEAIKNKKTDEAVKIINQLSNEGKDIYKFTDELCQYYRNMLLIKTGIEDEEIVVLPENSQKSVKKQAEKYSIEELFYIINILLNVPSKMKYVSSPKIPLELAVIKLANADKIASLDKVLEKISKLSGTGNLKIKAEKSGNSDDVIREKPAVYTKSNSDTKEQGNKIKPDKDISGEQNSLLKNNPVKNFKKTWDNIINQVKEKKMSLGTYLSEAKLIDIKEDKIILGVHPRLDFYKNILEESKNKKFIEKILTGIFNKNIIIEFKKHLPEDKEDKTEEFKKKEILSNKMVKSAVELFQGKIVYNGKANPDVTDPDSHKGFDNIEQKQEDI